jgi:hypothetical protein
VYFTSLISEQESKIAKIGGMKVRPYLPHFILIRSSVIRRELIDLQKGMNVDLKKGSI